MSRLPPRAALSWTADSEPSAANFNDVYFSRKGGLAESEAVFLRGCGLPEAWARRDRFALCELGFGTGLNIIAAWRAWKTTRSPHAILHISSIEAFPLEREDAARALAQFPEVRDLAATLIECWPVRAYAPQRIWFAEEGLSLTLHTGEAETILAGMSACFDAWFLDGFAPSRNPAMWSDAVFAEIARLSAPGARLATFSVAGSVRRGLEQVGFAVEKKPGFAAKRQRLEAVFLGRRHPALANPQASAGGTTGRRRVAGGPYPYAASHPKRVAIIGAGIAGAACAQALAQRGVETVVLEAAPTLGAGASFNPAGLVTPRLDRGGVLREFFLAAYLHAIATYEALDAFIGRGVEQRAEPRTNAALADLLAHPPLPPDWFSPCDGGAMHARAGLISPLAAVERMLAGAEVLHEAPVAALERAGEAWILRAPDGRARLQADAVVLACGAGLARFAQARFLPLELTRGQIEWGLGPAPPHALTRGTYAAPFVGGVLFGATFDAPDAGVSEADARVRNLAALARLAPEIAASIDASGLKSRAALRASLPDRAPAAGLLPDAEAWLARYAALAHGGAIASGEVPPAHDGLYVLAGLGARGFTNAPILGERIASEMFGEPQMLSRAALDALHPARFLLRALKRGAS